MSKTIKFSVDNIEWIDKAEDSLFRKIKIHAFATGENAHTLPIDLEVLERGAKTIYNKPIVWRYNKFIDDAEGHEKDEYPCGFIPDSEDNPIEFVEEMGKVFIVIHALIWTKYCGRLVEIFNRDGSEKSVSVEIMHLEDTSVDDIKPKIKEFVIAGITILGEHINPAVKGCRAEMLEFSEDKGKYLGLNIMKIDDVIGSFSDGAWRNPRRKLFNSIIQFDNRNFLLDDAYFIGGSDELEMTKFEFPHHTVSDGKLVLHKAGLISAYKNMSNKGFISKRVSDHLSRHFQQLGMTELNFSEFGVSENDFMIYFSNYFTKEKVGDTEMSEVNKNPDTSIEFEDKKEMAEGVKEKEDSSEMQEVNAEEDMSEKDSSKESKFDDDDESGEEVVEEKDDVQSESESEMSKDEQMCKMAKELEVLREENKAYMQKMESMSDYEELKCYKQESEAKMAKEEELKKMSAVMEDINKKGINMSDEEKTEIMSKIEEYSSVDAWANFAKAQVFDRMDFSSEKEVQGVTRVAIFENESRRQSEGLWD